MIPAAASIHGLNGTFFRTDLDLLNQSYQDAALVELSYVRTGRSVTISLAPREAMALQDVVGALFEAPETFGAITIRWSGGQIAASSRTYTTAASGGAIGTRVPAETPWSARGVTFIGLASSGGEPDRGFRSNVTVFNPDGSQRAQVTFALFDGQASRIGHSYSVEVERSLQINDVFAACGAAKVATKNARLVVTSTVPVHSYATVIDNVSGDSLLVLPAYSAASPEADRVVMYPLPPQPHIVIPSAVSKRGARGLLFQTDLWLANFGEAPATRTLTYEALEGEVTVRRSVSVTLQANETKLWEDAVQSLLGSTDSFGAIHLLPPGLNDGLGPVGVVSRVYSACGSSGGTCGGEFPALNGSRYGRLVFPGVRSHGADLALGHRTNVGLTSDYPLFTSPRASLYDVHGALVGHPVDLVPPAETPWSATRPIQINDLFAAAGAPDDITYATLVLDAVDSAVYPYVTVIDNQSGDIVVIPPIGDLTPP